MWGGIQYLWSPMAIRQAYKRDTTGVEMSCFVDNNGRGGECVVGSSARSVAAAARHARRRPPPSSGQMPAPLRGTPDCGRAAAAGDAAAAAAEAAAGVERWRRVRGGRWRRFFSELAAARGRWPIGYGLEEKCDARCERSCVGPRRIDVRKLLNGRHPVVTRIFSA